MSHAEDILTLFMLGLYGKLPGYYRVIARLLPSYYRVITWLLLDNNYTNSRVSRALSVLFAFFPFLNFLLTLLSLQVSINCTQPGHSYTQVFFTIYIITRFKLFLKIIPHTLAPLQKLFKQFFRHSYLLFLDVQLPACYLNHYLNHRLIYIALCHNTEVQQKLYRNKI